MDQKQIIEQNNTKLKESNAILTEKGKQSLGAKSDKKLPPIQKKILDKCQHHNQRKQQAKVGALYEIQPSKQEQQNIIKIQHKSNQMDQEQYQEQNFSEEEIMQQQYQDQQEAERRNQGIMNSLVHLNNQTQITVKIQENIIKYEHQANNSIQNQNIDDQCSCPSCVKLRLLEQRLAQIESQAILRARTVVPKKQTKTGPKKIRRKANQIIRKYKCINFKGCSKAFGTRSAIKCHIWNIHKIPKNQVTFMNGQVHISSECKLE